MYSSSLNQGLIFHTLHNDWNVGHHIRIGDIWEPYIYKICGVVLDKESVFLDIGSAYGYHALRAAALCKEVLSFEPQQILYDLQRLSLRDNDISNVSLLHSAVGDRDENVSMDVADYDSMSNVGNLSVGEGGASVPCTRIDSLDLPRVDLIKCDVQGYEERVLLGALSTLARCRPVLIVEFESVHLVKFGSSSKRLVSSLRDAGYELFLIDAPYPSDVLCVPLERGDALVSKLTVGDVVDNEVNSPLEAGILRSVLL